MTYTLFLIVLVILNFGVGLELNKSGEKSSLDTFAKGVLALDVVSFILVGA